MNDASSIELRVNHLLREAGREAPLMEEIRKHDVRSGIELLVLSQHVAGAQELVALMANEELIGRIVRISEDLLVTQVTDVGNALHLNAVVTWHKVRQRGNNGGGLKAEQRPVTSNHVRRTKDEVGGSLHRINERVLVGLVVDARGRRSVPSNETSISTSTQIKDDLTVLLVLKRVGDSVEQNGLSADVVHRGEILISFLRPDGLQLHNLCSHRSGADLDLIVHDRLITFRVKLVGNRPRRSGRNTRDSDSTRHIVHCDT